MSVEYPFTGYVAEIINTTSLPTFKEFAWDFDTDTFIRNANGKRIILEEDEALKVWIYKALKTERYEYLAYSWQYGIEIKPYIGKVMSVEERYSELRRLIIECLMVNPYIKSVDSIEFTETSGDTVVCEITLTTVYGEVNVNV